jgi:hypothetical protein
MEPFFSYFGGKHKLARRYGPPRRDVVIEPFAGSAGYSVYWEPKKVVLVDINPIISGVWKYLTRVKAQEIISLPVDIDDVDQLTGFPQEARWLVGFWFNCGCSSPSVRRSSWARQYKYDSAANVWNKATRLRIASQVERIRHWKIVHASWERLAEAEFNPEVHWHIDPPYSVAGQSYRFNAIDYPRLAAWCMTRRGLVHVCEAGGADWLPFRHFTTANGTERKAKGKTTVEVLWERAHYEGETVTG